MYLEGLYLCLEILHRRLNHGLGMSVLSGQGSAFGSGAGIASVCSFVCVRRAFACLFRSVTGSSYASGCCE